MHLVFNAMPTAEAAHLWDGGTDAYGLLPETRRSDGDGYPCRHCLRNIDAGEDVMVLPAFFGITALCGDRPRLSPPGAVPPA